MIIFIDRIGKGINGSCMGRKKFIQSIIVVMKVTIVDGQFVYFIVAFEEIFSDKGGTVSNRVTDRLTETLPARVAKFAKVSDMR